MREPSRFGRLLLEKYYTLKEAVIELYIDTKYSYHLTGDAPTESEIEKERATCGKLKSIDIIHYIKETIDCIVNYKDEEMMLRVYNENNKYQSRKIKHIQNFVEYRCKDKADRERFAHDVLAKQKQKKEEFLKKIYGHEESPQKKIKNRINDNNSNLIHIQDDFSNQSPSCDGDQSNKGPASTLSMRRNRDMGDQSFSFISDSNISVGAEIAFVYEQWIQKLEKDVRNHIKVENQLKLILESTQFKMEEYDHKIQKITGDYEQRLEKERSMIKELEDKIKEQKQKNKPLRINLSSQQTGHTGSIIAGYSGPVTDSNNIRSKSAIRNEDTPISELGTLKKRRPSLQRDRRKSITANPSNANSMHKYDERRSKEDFSKTRSCNFLNSLMQESANPSQNLSNKQPFFKIKNIFKDTSNSQFTNSGLIQTSRLSNPEALKSEISKKLIKQYLSNRKKDSEFQHFGPAKGEDDYLQNMIKLINFEVDNLPTHAPATCLKFNSSKKTKSRSNSKK